MDGVLTVYFCYFQYRYFGLCIDTLVSSVDDVSVHGKPCTGYMRISWLTSSSAPFFLDVSVHADNVPVHAEFVFKYRACIGRTGVRQGFGVTCTGTCKTCTDTCQTRKLQNLLQCLKSPPELTYRLLFFPARLEYLLYLLLQFIWSSNGHFTSFYLRITSSFPTNKSEA